MKYPTREDQQRAWERFNALRDQASVHADRHGEERSWRSGQHRSEILRQVEAARPTSLGGLLPPDVDEMKALGRMVSEAGKMLSRYKTDMLGEHKQECFSAIQDMRTVHDAWWADLKTQRSKRQGEWRERVRANLERNYERHRRATDGLEHNRRHAAALRDKIASAWSDDYVDRASGWLAETEAKISDIEASIEQIESWIQEDESKLA